MCVCTPIYNTFIYICVCVPPPYEFYAYMYKYNMHILSKLINIISSLFFIHLFIYLFKMMEIFPLLYISSSFFISSLYDDDDDDDDE